MTLTGFPFAAGAPAVCAPAAGGPFGGRGRALVALWALWALPGLSQEDMVAVPSGLEVRFHDVIQDAMGDGYTYRFRFVMPAIGQGVEFPEVVPDMDYLCNEYALKRVPYPGPRPKRIVISLMSEPTEFGVMNPDVVQFFESYSIENALCIWEAF